MGSLSWKPFFLEFRIRRVVYLGIWIDIFYSDDCKRLPTNNIKVPGSFTDSFARVPDMSEFPLERRWKRLWKGVGERNIVNTSRQKSFLLFSVLDDCELVRVASVELLEEIGLRVRTVLSGFACKKLNWKLGNIFFRILNSQELQTRSIGLLWLEISNSCLKKFSYCKCALLKYGNWTERSRSENVLYRAKRRNTSFLEKVVEW